MATELIPPEPTRRSPKPLHSSFLSEILAVPESLARAPSGFYYPALKEPRASLVARGILCQVMGVGLEMNPVTNQPHCVVKGVA